MLYWKYIRFTAYYIFIIASQVAIRNSTSMLRHQVQHSLLPYVPCEHGRQHALNHRHTHGDSAASIPLSGPEGGGALQGGGRGRNSAYPGGDTWV